MSEEAYTSLERALKRMRDKEAFALGWRVISCTTYDGSDASFYYTQGQAKPNYPMPAIQYEVQFLASSVCVFHRSGSCEYDVYFIKS